MAAFSGASRAPLTQSVHSLRRSHSPAGDSALGGGDADHGQPAKGGDSHADRPAAPDDLAASVYCPGISSGRPGLYSP